MHLVEGLFSKAKDAIMLLQESPDPTINRVMKELGKFSKFM